MLYIYLVWFVEGCRFFSGVILSEPLPYFMGSGCYRQFFWCVGVIWPYSMSFSRHMSLSKCHIFFVITLQYNTVVQSVRPIFFYLVVKYKYVQQVFNILLLGVFDSKVVNYKRWTALVKFYVWTGQECDQLQTNYAFLGALSKVYYIQQIILQYIKRFLILSLN